MRNYFIRTLKSYILCRFGYVLHSCENALSRVVYGNLFSG